MPSVPSAETVVRRSRAAARSVAAAVMNPIHVRDPLVDVQDATRQHRRRHRCGAYTYGDASLPATLVAATAAERVIEVGTALGYTALSMASATPQTHVDTIEMELEHVELAREQVERKGMADRVTVLHGTADDVLPTKDEGAYDLAFFDGFTPTIEVVRELHRVLRPGGLLVAGNLILRPSPEVSRFLSDPSVWQVHCLGETALCVKR